MKEFDEYQALAIRTAKRVDEKYDLTHAALGMSGEVGELVDAIKKHVIYGRPLDRVNVVEEVGDILWFAAFLCTTTGIDLREAAQLNIDKLKLRYPETYSDVFAHQRLDKGE